MADEPTWREREAAGAPRGVAIDPQREPVPGVRAFPSVYAPGHLVITGDPEAALVELEAAAGKFGWTIDRDPIAPDRNANARGVNPVGPDDADARPVDPADAEGRERDELARGRRADVRGRDPRLVDRRAQAREPRNTQLTLAWVRQAPRGDRDDEPVPPVDAWRLLQKARDLKRPSPTEPNADGPIFGTNNPVRRTDVAESEPVDPDDPLRNVGLDHVLHVGKHSPDRYTRTNPMAVVDRYTRTNPGSGPDSYGYPGTGGLEVITYVGADPVPLHTVQAGGRRPVVVVIDTGCGEHRWLPERKDPADPAYVEPWVWRRVPGPTPPKVVGVEEEKTNPEVFPDQSGPRDGRLDGSSGHGTFISGIIRQVSPDANIIAVRIADSDGSVLESELILALEELVELVEREDDPLQIDVVNLSLGFYHETPDDGRFSTRLYDALKDLRRNGVVVVCSAGNDATDRPAFPAALWDWGDPDLNISEASEPDLAPHFSVGALNPSLDSVALYSNIGDWVRVYSPGTSVLSTIPSFQGGMQAGSRSDKYGLKRMTIDVDDFRGGFAVWSGTSFAAPFVAGFIAQQLAPELTATGQRAKTVVADVLGGLTSHRRASLIAPDLRGREDGPEN